jgi:hypothetical protein
VHCSSLDRITTHEEGKQVPVGKWLGTKAELTIHPLQHNMSE